ncbi:MAG: MerR family transcriptional regulator [Solobacterium sp.]|jgi:DNA-binding transcriptional MerR regulator|nr:MerR family transcriptional regulator [Solobacterium sp.]MCH4206357.1 MerR family transcriptional regulator [Solobacterium sp.]MCH4227859.1 MerR family transcriptional regulator [Solobacterium sp.]MCH4283249.1 MerR family transcriptional regulator [Solobacterium sp.]
MKYGIKEVSSMVQIPLSTIRYYDAEGLLPFLERKESGYRIFSDGDIALLQVIECFKSTGMSIKDIRRFVELIKQGDETLQERYDMFAEQKKIIQKQMDDIQKQMDVVDHKLWYYRTAIEAGTEEIHRKAKRNKISK